MTRTTPVAPETDAGWTVVFQVALQMSGADEGTARLTAAANGFPRAHAEPVAAIRNGAGKPAEAATPHVGGYRGPRDWEIVLQATLDVTAESAEQAITHATHDLHDTGLFPADIDIDFEIVEMRRC